MFEIASCLAMTINLREGLMWKSFLCLLYKKIETESLTRQLAGHAQKIKIKL
jgi:hypothetical protein